MTIVNSRKNVTTFLWFFQHSGRILTPISLITVSQTRLFSKNPSIKAIMNSYLDRYLEKNKKPDAQNSQNIVFQSCFSRIFQDQKKSKTNMTDRAERGPVCQWRRKQTFSFWQVSTKKESEPWKVTRLEWLFLKKLIYQIY